MGVKMNTLGNTIGTRINKFDELDLYERTLGAFNELFPECPLKLDWEPNSITICEPTNNNCRMIILDDDAGSWQTIKHKMYSRHSVYLGQRNILPR